MYQHRYSPQHSRIQLYLLLWPFRFMMSARIKVWHDSLTEDPNANRVE